MSRKNIFIGIVLTLCFGLLMIGCQIKTVVEEEPSVKKEEPSVKKEEPSVKKGEPPVIREEVLLRKPEPNLFWNVWAERPGARYDPLPKLEKNRQYRIVLDLSALGYKLPGVTQIPPNPSLEKEIKAMARETNDLFFDLIAFVLPDTTYFEDPSHENRRKDLNVDLNKIRGYRGASMEEMWRDIRQNRETSKYVFGQEGFLLTTRENCDDGWASVAIVLFRNMRPVDEVKAVFCVGNCREEDKPMVPANASALHVLSEKSQPPDGALYFLELDRNKLVGLFLDSSSDGTNSHNYMSWNVATVEGLKDKIGKIFSELNNRYQKKDLERTGRTLMQNIFGNENTEEYKRFKAFVQKKIRETENRNVSPSLFVRVVTSDKKVSPFIPLGLLLIMDDTDPCRNFFLGQRFRVISPLPIRQSYARNNNCISSAVAFLPPDGKTSDTALENAKTAMADSLKNLGVRKQLKNMKDINDYLISGQTVGSSTALLILSHHSKDRIWFTNVEDYVAPGDFSFSFGMPSFAVLNACETAATDENDFVNTLNEKGMDAVIATASEVRGYMNGRFFFCLDKTIREKKGVPLSQIVHDTLVGCLWSDKDSDNISFEANVLKYVFLGNGDLTLCIK